VVRPEKESEGGRGYYTSATSEDTMNSKLYLYTLLDIIRMERKKRLKRLEVRRFESLVGGVRGMGIRAGDAENLKKKRYWHEDGGKVKTRTLKRIPGCGTLYDGVGSVKRHLDCIEPGGSFFLLT